MTDLAELDLEGEPTVVLRRDDGTPERQWHEERRRAQRCRECDGRLVPVRAIPGVAQCAICELTYAARALR